jgi:hypothetical protein
MNRVKMLVVCMLLVVVAWAPGSEAQEVVNPVAFEDLAEILSPQPGEVIADRMMVRVAIDQNVELQEVWVFIDPITVLLHKTEAVEDGRVIYEGVFDPFYFQGEYTTQYWGYFRLVSGQGFASSIEEVRVEPCCLDRPDPTAVTISIPSSIWNDLLC